MKLINGILYLTINEAVECGIASDNYIRKAKSEGTKCWNIIDDPADKRKVLIGYEALNDDRKRKVELRFGNPYDRVARTPILDMVINDRKANDYYMSYTYLPYVAIGQTPVEINLKPIRVYQYTRAASWLNMLAKVGEDRGIIKKQLGLTIPEFYIHCGDLIKLERERGKMEGYAGIDVLPADFPGTYQRLLDKVKRYQTEGYDMLIDPLFGNKLGSKLGKVDSNSDNKEGAFAPERYEDQMAVIRFCLEKGNNLDAGQVEKMANHVFREKGWKTISRKAINDILLKKGHILTAGRQGGKTHANKIERQVKRKVTEMPLMYWTLDGWTIELGFQERGDNGIEYKRLVVVVVLDAWRKYIVGYAIGERETAELIREANRNALLHVGDVFRGAYRPWQVQSDRYQLKNLTPFYQAMTHLHTPAKVGNAKSKIIEPYFKDLNKNYCQFMPNWTGFGVTADKDNQVNREMMDKNKTNYPDRAGVIKQIEMIIATERKKKIDAYVFPFAQQLQGNDAPELMQPIDWLRVFGKQLGKRPSRITGEGISKVVNNVEYTYDSFDPAFRANRHIKWTLFGDEQNMSRVLAVSEDEKLQFVLEHTRILPMDTRSTSDEDHAYRAQISQFNKTNADKIKELYGADATRVRDIVADVPFALDDAQELAMKAMWTTGGQQKEGIQNAKGLGKVQKQEQKRIAMEERKEADDWESKRLAFLKEM